MNENEREQLLADLAAGGIEWLIKEPWGAVGVNEIKGLCFLHCRIWAWTPSHRKLCEEHWARIIDTIRGRGYKVIYARQVEGDTKMRKFHRMFGFSTEVLHIGGFAVMRQEI